MFLVKLLKLEQKVSNTHLEINMEATKELKVMPRLFCYLFAVLDSFIILREFTVHGKS